MFEVIVVNKNKDIKSGIMKLINWIDKIVMNMMIIYRIIWDCIEIDWFVLENDDFMCLIVLKIMGFFMRYICCILYYFNRFLRILLIGSWFMRLIIFDCYC